MHLDNCYKHGLWPANKIKAFKKVGNSPGTHTSMLCGVYVLLSGKCEGGCVQPHETACCTASVFLSTMLTCFGKVKLRSTKQNQ